MPYSSTTKPINAQRISMSNMPATKASVPFHFWRRAKKATVLVVPIMSVRPIRKRIWSGVGQMEIRGGGRMRTLPIASLERCISERLVGEEEGGLTLRDQKTSSLRP
jgi:hypothetical protein